ncbi:MAG: permease [Pirellulaceae bacterium]|nr:permease [Pirellulaceae bacterium]
MDNLFWGATLRFVQVAIFAAPWIATGFVIAAVFRVFLGPERTRRLFAGNGWRGILNGWLWGMLLPVCSLGVIPIVRELHRSGVKGGALIAFALTAPLFNPLSLLYGLTLSDPVAIITFAGCSLLIVTCVGLLWDRIFSANEEVTAAPETRIPYGIKRIVAVAKTATQMIYSPAMLFILIGIAGSVVISLLMPHGSMSTMLERENGLAPLLVAGVSVPIYSTPLLAMSQIGSMFQHGNSIGAAFSLLIFGAGVNLGLFACFLRMYTAKQLFGFLGLLLGIGIGLAYLVSEPLFPKGVEVAGHTHAFDVYTNPFMPTSTDLPRQTRLEISKHWGNHEFGGTVILAGMILLGALFFLLDKWTKLNAWLTDFSSQSNLDRELPTSVVATCSIAGLLAMSVVGCYVYYPAQTQTLAEMRIFNAEAVVSAKSGNWEGAVKWIAFQEDLARRLEIGTFIRSGTLSEFRRTKARIFREDLERLKHGVEDQNRRECDEIAMQVDKSFRRLSTAFKDAEP